MALRRTESMYEDKSKSKIKCRIIQEYFVLESWIK